MSIVILVVFVVLVAIVLILIRHKRMKDEEERQKSMRALGLEGVRPVIKTISNDIQSECADYAPLVPLSYKRLL